jgi:ABC-2 type transport system permease protein
MVFRMFQAFLLRDFRQTVSYKFAFLLDVASVFFSAATFYFVSQLFGAATAPQLEGYGGQYFPFVLIGIAFSTYQTVGLTSFSQSLRQEQFMGTLESIMASPIRISTFLTGSALWDFAYATLEVGFYFLVGFLAFDLTLPKANLWPALAALVLTLTTFMGLGILAAAFILLFKRGNPVTWTIATASELLGGVYFPTKILPDWMKRISDWIPMSHALESLRSTLLAGAGFSEVGPHLAFLGVFSVVVWAVSIFAFQMALKKTQDDGSLSHY